MKKLILIALATLSLAACGEPQAASEIEITCQIAPLTKLLTELKEDIDNIDTYRASPGMIDQYVDDAEDHLEETVKALEDLNCFEDK